MANITLIILTNKLKLIKKIIIEGNAEAFGGRTVNYDKPLLAMLIGAIVIIPLEIMGLFFKHLGWITITHGEACSMMFMPEGSWTLGLLALPSVGAIAILILYYLTKIMGTDYLPIKGTLVGMCTYSFVFTVFGTLSNNNHMLQSALGNYIFALSSGFAGFLAGILMKKYLFNETSQKIRRYSIVPLRSKKKKKT